MEWVDGQLLRNILAQQKKLPVERAVRIAVASLSSRAGRKTHVFAFARGLIPATIFLLLLYLARRQ